MASPVLTEERQVYPLNAVRVAAPALFFFRVKHLSGFQIDHVQLSANQAFHRLARVIVVGHLIGRPALNGLAGGRTGIQKSRRHLVTIA